MSWARKAPHDASLALLVDVDRGAGRDDEAEVLRKAVSAFFARR
ncbi:MAG TPA: hypothetical protein VFW15_14090 [Thermoanaerobaculia bacterium]|nr:hypothetical protein [Thermoanaerobaculia bacterium]